MTIHSITFVYGTVITWEALKNSGYVSEDFIADKESEDYHEKYCVNYEDEDYDNLLSYTQSKPKINGLRAFQAQHDMIEKSTLEDPKRLPSTKKGEILVVGVNVGHATLQGNGKKDKLLDYNKIVRAKKRFDEKIEKKLLEIGGTPNLHMVTDACGCCS